MNDSSFYNIRTESISGGDSRFLFSVVDEHVRTILRLEKQENSQVYALHQIKENAITFIASGFESERQRLWETRSKTCSTYMNLVRSLEPYGRIYPQVAEGVKKEVLATHSQRLLLMKQEIIAYFAPVQLSLSPSSLSPSSLSSPAASIARDEENVKYEYATMNQELMLRFSLVASALEAMKFT